jgi:hypothetical protein
MHAFPYTIDITYGIILYVIIILVQGGYPYLRQYYDRLRIEAAVRSITRKTATTGDFDILCERCETMNLGKYMWHLHPTTPRKTEINIDVDTFQGYCAACTFFRKCDFGRASVVHDTHTKLGQNRVYDILTLQNQTIVGWRSMVTTLSMCRTQAPLRELHLLLTQDLCTQNDEVLSGSRTKTLRHTSLPNLSFIRRWIDHCRDTHKQAATGCKSLKLQRTTKLKVIDCRTRKLRYLEDGEKYVCLSYVWGKTSYGRIHGNDIPEVLPKTIEDAMCVAITLGIPQLWVDQYCIGQEGPKDRHDAIASMHLIYGGADLTIIAAAGEDASHGLPGIRGTTRNPPQLVRIRTGSFYISEDTREQVKHSRWNTRGWTYQEGLLSPDVLFSPIRESISSVELCIVMNTSMSISKVGISCLT